MMEFYDFDPDAKDQATEASRARVKEGFKNLVASLEAVSAGSRDQIEANRRKQFEASNRYHDAMEDRTIEERLGLNKEPEGYY